MEKIQPLFSQLTLMTHVFKPTIASKDTGTKIKIPETSSSRRCLCRSFQNKICELFKIIIRLTKELNSEINIVGDRCILIRKLFFIPKNPFKSYRKLLHEKVFNGRSF